MLHAVRLLVPVVPSLPPGERPTEMPVSTMVARETGGIYNETSPNGLAEMLKNLAAAINQAHELTPLGYQIEYASAAEKGKKPLAPDVRVTREGVRLSVFTD